MLPKGSQELPKQIAFIYKGIVNVKKKKVP